MCQNPWRRTEGLGLYPISFDYCPCTRCHGLSHKSWSSTAEVCVAFPLPECLLVSAWLHWRGLSPAGQLYGRSAGEWQLLRFVLTERMHMRGLPILWLYQRWIQEWQSARGRFLLCGLRQHRVLLPCGRRPDHVPLHQLSWDATELHRCVRACRWLHAVRTHRVCP